MIDLAALTQALDTYEKLGGWDGFNVVTHETLTPVIDAARIPTRLWQPCQTCGGTGTEVTEIRRSPLGSGLPSSMYVIIDEIREECPSCGGVGVEPTPLLHDLTHKLMSDIADPSKTVRVDEFALELWRVANEETD